MTATIHHGDCLDVLRQMPDNSVHAIVTDPPYGLSNTTPDQVAETIVRWVSGDREHLPSGRGFMGKEWDGFVPPVAVWDEAMRVLKPGGHVLAFAGTRTVDLMTLGLRLAGFDIRDSLAWLYGNGFPKSMDVSKAIDKMGVDPLAFRRFAKAYAEAVTASPMTHTDIDRHLGIKSSSCYWAREDHRGGMPPRHHWESVRDLLSLDAELERLYDEAEREVVGTRTTGIGAGSGAVSYIGDSDNRDITAPATDAAKQWEGWGSATKPAHEPIVMARKPFKGTLAANVLEHGVGALNIDATRIEHDAKSAAWVEKWSGHKGHPKAEGWGTRGTTFGGNPSGRWPANVILDEEMAGVLDQQSGVTTSKAANRGNLADIRGGKFNAGEGARIEGTDTLRGHNDSGGASRFFYVAKASKKERPDVDGIKHPTVKPLTLMRWLVRLVTPPNGIVLDPFAGSGTTIEAAMLEGFQVIGIEREAEYLPLIRHRIERAQERIKTEQQQQAEAPDQGAFPLEDIA